MANQIELYIRREAAKRGMDPDVVMAIVNGEGGTAEPALRSRGHDASIGGQEQSYGPFQLNMASGLGADLLRTQGIDVRDPANVYKGIDYALAQAASGGWGPWLNTMNKLGYGRWTGIRTPATGSAPAGDVGGLGRGSIMAAQQRGDAAGGGGGDTKVASGDIPPLPPIGDKPETGADSLKGGFKDIASAFGDAIQQPRPLNVPMNADMGGGAPMPSFFRPQLAPTSLAAGSGQMGGMGGGTDMRQLLALLMQQQGGYA
jgi:hypothetical protein